MEHSHEPRGGTNVDKKSAAFGFVGGILVLCTIGFFILLGVVLNKDGADVVEAQDPTPTVIEPSNPQPTNVKITLTDSDHVFGNEDAKITIVEYSDFDCPYCSKHHPTVEQVVNDNAGKVNWVYRHFPLRSLHPLAARKAEASECVAQVAGNDAFWKFTDDVFKGVASETDDNLASIAQTAGADKTKFSECLTNGGGKAAVEEDEKSGLAAGVQGTPHSVIIGPDGEGIPLSGALPAVQLQAVIDSL